MKQFTLDPEIIRSHRKKTIILIILLGTLINAVAIIYFFGTGNEDKLFLNLFPVVLVSLIVSGVLVSAITRTARLNSSYKLTIGDDYVMREIGRFPPVRFSFDEITGIDKLATGSYKINGSNPQIYIVVPANIMQKMELEQELLRIHTLTKETSNSSKKYLPFIAALLSAALMIIFYTVKNKWIFVPAGFSVIVLLIVASIITLRSPLLSKAFKSRVILYLIIVVSMILTLYTKLKMA